MSRLSDESWVKLPLKLLKAQGLSKGAAAICCCIIDICGKAGLEQYTAISTSELAAATGYAVRTAKRAVLELEALGLIEIRRSTGSASSYKLTGCVELCPAVFKSPERAVQKPTPRASKKQRSSDSGTDYGAFIQAQQERMLSMSDEEFAEYMSGSSSRRSSTKRRKKALTPEELAEMQEYLSLANRFSDAADEPLPGQQSFFDKEVST